MCLFEQYKKKNEHNGKDKEKNFGSELNQLQISVAEKLMDKTDNIRKWIVGGKEENKFLTDKNRGNDSRRKR